MIENLLTWTIQWAQTPFGSLALFLIAFAESSFFPIAPDILLIALCLINPSFSLFYALITLVGSVLGGIFGYIIGIKGGRPLLERIVSKEKIELAHNYFERFEAWAIIIAGFTPIPYKVFTISAGALYVNFKTFVIASIIGRGGRFFIVAFSILLFGKEIESFLRRNFNIASIVFIILLLAGFIILKKLPIFNPQKTLNKSNEPK